MLRMLNAALSEGTKNVYKRSITSYAAFSRKQFPNCSVFPASTGVLATYIAILFSKHYAPATLMTYMSALTYIKKTSGMPDPTQHSAITKLLAGAQKLAGKPDTRLPITPIVLCQIVDSTQFIASSDYLRYMLQSMFLLAFHAFLRIGEKKVHSRTRSEYVIQLADVTISHSHIVLVLCHFKHNTSGRPVTLLISQTHNKYCPVQALSRFLKVRGSFNGPLFAFANASPVSRNYCCQYLRKALQWVGLDPSKYKAHSFRIGAATTAADMEMSETQILSMGRWKSTAFKRYIRIPMLQMTRP